MEEDILFALKHASRFGLQLYWCLCPNANLYIENRLPPVGLLRKHECTIVIGTDSYSSNWQLNLAEEIRTLSKHFPQIALEEILQWATSNGAKALGRPDVGQFREGADPGVILLGENFSVKRIV
jgi:cytosine/adenosine deaminase-related metal-dependent hydrolase